MDNNNNNPNDMENMMKMMEMVQLMQSLMQQNNSDQTFSNSEESSDNEDSNNDDIKELQLNKQAQDNIPISYTEYDQKIQTPALKAIKAAIPHLEYKHRKNMSIFIKLIEIQKLLSIYGENAMIMSFENEGDWRKNMLMAIRPYMPIQKQYSIDVIIKCIDIKELMIKSKEISDKEVFDKEIFDSDFSWKK